MNTHIIHGRLGKNPDVKVFESGSICAKFSVATNRYYTDKQGQRVELTEWHDVVAWGKTAELCRDYLAKGREVLLEGTVSHRKYETSADLPLAEGEGTARVKVTRYVTETIVHKVTFVGSKPTTNFPSEQDEPGATKPAESTLEQPAEEPVNAGDQTNDDTPF